MKLTLKIKLLPNDTISEVAWQEKIFNKVRLYMQVYYPLRSTFKLSSQMLIRSIAMCQVIAHVASGLKLNPSLGVVG